MNVREVQESVVEHSAMYAKNPEVLGGMLPVSDVGDVWAIFFLVYFCFFLWVTYRIFKKYLSHLLCVFTNCFFYVFIASIRE